MTEAQLAAEVADCDSKVALLQKRLADPVLLKGEEADTLDSWRSELSRLERHIAALRRRRERQP